MCTEAHYITKTITVYLKITRCYVILMDVNVTVNLSQNMMSIEKKKHKNSEMK